MPVEPIVALSLGLAALICLLGPVALGLWWEQRTGTPISVFGWGMLVFAVALLLRGWQFPLDRWVHADHARWMTPVLLAQSLTAGLFEETGRWIGYRTALRGRYTRRVGIMYGLGHGGCESMLIAGIPLAGLLIAWVLAAQGRIPSGPALEALRQQTETVAAWGVQLAVVERAAAMALHVGLSLIVLQCFTRGSIGWLALAIGIHTAVDAVGVLLATHVIAVYTELVIAILAVVVLRAGLRLSAPEPPPALPPPPR